MSTDGVLGAVWLPTDGWLDPSGLAQALAAGARAARRPDPARRRRVVAIGIERGRVTGVTVEHGGERTEIRADVVVNAGGMFAPEIGRLVGVTVPIIPMAHQYLFTEPIEGVHPGLPQLRDPDNLVYFREEVGGLCMGGYERDPAPWSLDGIPPDFNGKLLAPDWQRFEPIMEGAIRRVPSMADAGVNRVINGPEAFTPDNEFILGEIGGRVASSSRPGSGPTASPARAASAARWRPGSSTASPSSTSGRWTSGGSGPPIAASRTRWRGRSRTTRPTTTSTTRTRSARPVARCGLAPTYEILDGAGRVVRREVRLGAPELVRARTPPTATEALRPRGWAGEHWSPAIGAEALATRRAAGLFDETSFSKLEIVGPGAVAFLQSMCGNDVDVPVGRIVYTQLLNRRGGIECDVTVTRVTADRYLFVTGTAYGQHDLVVARAGTCRTTGACSVNDITSGRVCFALWGPRARDILAPLTRDDVSDAAFPYLTARAITVGSVPVYALRVTYVGELGWELYAHTEFGQALWRTLWEAGRPHGMVAGGYRAIDALRLEKGYRVWSSDITPDETPFEAGLGFAVALDKERRVHRPRRARRGQGGRAAQAPALPRARRRRARSASATSRCASTARSSAG